MLYITIPILANISGNTPTEVGSYASNIVGMILSVAAVATLAYLIMGGLSWITASGDKGKLEEAKNRITGAIVGLAIVAVSWAIFLVIDSFFGLGIAGGKSSSGGVKGGGGSGSGSGGESSAGVCIYPSRRCCNDVSDSTCFCQNPNVNASSYGSCDAGGGQTGVRCGCVPK